MRSKVLGEQGGRITFLTSNLKTGTTTHDMVSCWRVQADHIKGVDLFKKNVVLKIGIFNQFSSVVQSRGLWNFRTDIVVIQRSMEWKINLILKYVCIPMDNAHIYYGTLFYV